jgi:sugar transferase (PEP-CTERM/EpsH1 system associated)
MAGFSTRNYHMLKALASRHTVSLFALNDSTTGIHLNMSLLEDIVQDLKIFTRTRVLPKRWEQLICITRGKPHILNEYHAEELQKAIDEAVASNHYDIVLFESVLTAGYILPPNIPFIIDQHNLEYEILLRTSVREKARLRKWYNKIEAHLLKPIEIERCRKASAVLVTSEREHFELKQLLPESVIKVVPNGVDTDKFDINHTFEEIEDRIIFTGALDYYPNMDAVLFFAQHCWPYIHAHIPTATWQTVGKNPPSQIQRLAELPGVTVVGSIPDIVPYLAKAQVAIAPILIGSGTRLKILEAFATQKAVVSTRIGCEGLEVESGKHLIIADQPEMLARSVVALLENPEKRNALGRAGRSLVEARYSWKHCTYELLRLLDEIQQEGIRERVFSSNP